MDNKEEGEQQIPRCLIESFNAAFAAGQWSGDLEGFIAVRYLLFRTRYAADSSREPPGKARWLKNLLDYERLCEEGKPKK